MICYACRSRMPEPGKCRICGMVAPLVNSDEEDSEAVRNMEKTARDYLFNYLLDGLKVTLKSYEFDVSRDGVRLVRESELPLADCSDMWYGKEQWLDDEIYVTADREIPVGGYIEKKGMRRSWSVNLSQPASGNEEKYYRIGFRLVEGLNFVVLCGRQGDCVASDPISLTQFLEV